MVFGLILEWKTWFYSFTFNGKFLFPFAWFTIFEHAGPDTLDVSKRDGVFYFNILYGMLLANVSQQSNHSCSEFIKIGAKDTNPRIIFRNRIIVSARTGNHSSRF